MGSGEWTAGVLRPPHLSGGQAVTAQVPLGWRAHFQSLLPALNLKEFPPPTSRALGKETLLRVVSRAFNGRGLGAF